jgi:lipopolysaccharide export LptBFGC system permease protein LptF
VVTGLFVGILLVANAVRDITDWAAMGCLTLFDSCQLLWIRTPSAISDALPFGMMTSILILIGRMSSNNEILAMKSIAMSLTGITCPIFVLSFIFTLFYAYINLFYSL